MKRYLFFLMCFVAAFVAAAQSTVTGVVYEPSGETAIGASVYEKGKEGTGAVTDLDGKFFLKVSSLDATIIVSDVGMETQKIKLAGRSSVDVYLKDSKNALNEVVV
ncbi:MAG: carboxypeptidase-like regulatory domain-containing protein, partial [Muribaculaceae bacterium]|nr:carboxypeptidase-like regulatory domain-containing protein [Muribaculaceae bacterium]